MKWREKARQLKTEVYVLFLALKDRRTPWYAKALAGVVVAYALSPVDLIPDFIPVLGYLDPDFLGIMDETMALLRRLFQTENQLSIALPGTGMAAMEAAICNVVEPGDEVIVGIHDFFGQQMAEIVERHGGTAVRVEVEFGQVVETAQIEAALDGSPNAKMVAVVHGETSSGIGQPLEEIGRVVR